MAANSALIRASAMTWGEVKRGEVKRGEVKRGEVKRGEVKRGEVKRGEVKRGTLAGCANGKWRWRGARRSGPP